MTRMVVSESLTPTIFQRDESYLITTNGKKILLSEKLEETKCACSVNSQHALNTYAVYRCMCHPLGILRAMREKW